MSQNNIDGDTNSNPNLAGMMGPFILLSALLPGLFGAFALYINRSQGHIIFRATGFPVWVLGIFAVILVPLFIFEWIRDGLVGDIPIISGDMNMSSSADYFRAYLADFLRAARWIILVLLLVWVFSEIASLFLSILGVGTPDKRLLTNLYAYLISLLPLLVLTAFFFFLVQSIKNKAVALWVGAALYIATRCLVYIRNPLGKLNPAFYMDWHLKWLDPAVNWGELWLATGYLMVLLLAFFIGGYLLFKRGHE